jgi:hypothetical protein
MFTKTLNRGLYHNQAHLGFYLGLYLTHFTKLHTKIPNPSAMLVVTTTPILTMPQVRVFFLAKRNQIGEILIFFLVGKF